MDAAITGLENIVKVCAFNINILNTYMYVSFHTPFPSHDFVTPALS